MAGSLFSNAVINFTINAQNALQELTGFQQKFSSGISQMRGLLAGFVGFQGLRGAYNQLTQLVNIADKWHMPVEQVSRFTNLFAEFGGTMDDAVASLDKFQNMANQLKFHSSGPLRELSAVLRANLANKDYMGVIKTLRSQWQHLTPDAQAEVQNMLGVDGAAMRRMLSATDQEFAAAIKRSEKFATINAQNADALRDMEKALAETKVALTALAMPFLEIFQPILGVVRDVALWITQLPDGVKQFTAALLLALPVIKTLIGFFTGGAIVKGLVALTNPVTWIIAAIATVAAGAYVLYKNWDKIVDAIHDFIDEHPALQKALEFMGYFVEGLIAPFKIILDVISAVKDGLDWLDRKFGGHRELTIEQKNAANQTLADMGIIPSPDTARAQMSYVNNKTSDSHNQSYVDNKTQNINIYGVTSTDDLITRLQSVGTQGLTPLMGAQG